MAFDRTFFGGLALLCLVTGVRTSDTEKEDTESEEASSYTTWIVVVVVLLALTLFLIGIIVYICCRRRLVRSKNLDTMETAALTPAEETEHRLSLKPFVSDVKQEVKDLLKGFEPSTKDIKKFMDLLDTQLIQGLQETTKTHCDVKMYPTFVKYLPDGNEFGEFLVVEFGSADLKVMLVDLKDIDTRYTKTRIPPEIKLGACVQLFDFIAEGVHAFMDANNLLHKQVHTVFVFSFPLKQEGLTKASLVEWTKGFNCTGVVGEDLGQLLMDALDRRSRDLKVEIVAIVNNGVDTLLSVAQTEHTCRVGLHVGNGFNACYMDYHVKQMLINTEWGGLGDDGSLDFIRTQFDKDLDSHSINPNRQTLEKMVSRMYMGELLRLVLEKLHKEKLLFASLPSGCPLLQRDGLDVNYVPKIESDTDEHYVCTNYMLKEMGIDSYTEQDLRTVHYACMVISERAAHLAAAAVATLLNRMDKAVVTVAVEGPVYRLHPHFKERLSAKMDQLVNPCLKFKLVSSHGRRGIGAALAGAMALRPPKRRPSVLGPVFARLTGQGHER